MQQDPSHYDGVGYPENGAARTRWIVSHRGPKRVHNPLRPYACFVEEEIDSGGTLQPTATLFLTNRECRYRCLMCDLWQDTLDDTTPDGVIPAQISHALAELSPAAQIKLYNAGSFFDPLSIPRADYPEIARLVEPFSRVIVECHPALIGESCIDFSHSINGKLEVAIGLETVHPVALDRLNKRFTLDDFRRSAEYLRNADIDLRVFLLLRPPYLSEEEGIEWAIRSLEFAFDSGATACAVIPVREGNGAMEALRQVGDWAPPKLRSLELVQEIGIGMQRGRVFADLWNIEKAIDCPCDLDRILRMDSMNRTQKIMPPVLCLHCTPAVR